MTTLANKETITTLRKIINKYEGYRYAHSIKSDPRIELMGYICTQTVSEGISPRLHEILLYYPFKHDVLSNDELQYLIEHKCVMADMLCSPSEIIGFEHYELMQPIELTQIAIAALHDLPQGTNIYNPYAGTNSYALAAPQYNFVGEELNTLTWAMGQMRLLLYGCKANIIEGNSLEKSVDAKYDAIITTPPFGFHNNSNSLLRLYNMLNDGGKLVFYAPLSFLFNIQNKSFRDMIIKEHALHTIVQLPSDVLLNTGINLSLIVIEKKINHFVRMMDARNFVHIRQPRENNSPTNKIMILCEWIKGTRSINNLCMDVTYASIRLNKNYDLRPSVYIAEQKLLAYKLPNLVPLRILLEPYHNSSRISKNDEIRKITVRELSEHLFISEKDFLYLPLSNPTASDMLLGDDNLLLMSKINNIRPTIFRLVKDKNVVVDRNGISVFKLVSNLVSLQYIVSELSKEYVQEQIEAYGLGSYFFRTTADRILDIKINIPSLTHRDEILEERSITSSKLELQERLLDKVGLQLQQLQDQKHNEYKNLMGQRKHAMQQIFNSVEPAINRLIKTMNKNNGVLRATDITSQLSKKTVAESLNNLYAQTKRLIEMVDSLTDEIEFSPSIEVNLYDMIEDFSSHWITSNYEINVAYMSETGFWINKPPINQFSRFTNKYIDYKLCIAPNAFRQILENIVANAVKHGFKDNKNNYVIQISTMQTTINDRDAVEIRIANNGEPLPVGITPEKVFICGVTSEDGEGKGGWQAKNIVEHYGGTISLKTNTDDSCFKIEYIITLPIIEAYERPCVMD